ncbi:MAG: hypothetical protein K2Q18_00055, partial [Bdellovibrionales bacterium]|nr:hypothetical protein [Bdellovibrionales bacterium]
MKKIILALAISTYCMNLMAACEVVEGGKKTPFDGKTVGSNSIEKKSLSIMNKEFPDLNIVEKSFKGEVPT